MDEQFLNKVVPVTPIKIEKVTFRENGMYLENQGQERKTYSYNVIYANELDPADGSHRFPLMPENPTFITIDARLSVADIELSEIPLEKQVEMLPKNMTEGMFGAWVNVDLTKRPVVRLYTTNVVKLVNGKPEVVHKVGTPQYKRGADGKDSTEYAIITQLPVWGFLRKNLEGKYFWLKGYDPMTRIDREINQGRMMYVDLLQDQQGLDTGNPEEKPAEEKAPDQLEDAPGLDQLG